jgi:hypothetical protein
VGTPVSRRPGKAVPCSWCQPRVPRRFPARRPARSLHAAPASPLSALRRQQRPSASMPTQRLCTTCVSPTKWPQRDQVAASSLPSDGARCRPSRHSGGALALALLDPNGLEDICATLFRPHIKPPSAAKAIEFTVSYFSGAPSAKSEAIHHALARSHRIGYCQAVFQGPRLPRGGKGVSESKGFARRVPGFSGTVRGRYRSPFFLAPLGSRDRTAGPSGDRWSRRTTDAARHARQVCGAASRPDMQFVSVETAREQSALMQRTPRQLLVDQRTAW